MTLLVMNVPAPPPALLHRQEVIRNWMVGSLGTRLYRGGGGGMLWLGGHLDVDHQLSLYSQECRKLTHISYPLYDVIMICSLVPRPRGRRETAWYLLLAHARTFPLYFRKIVTFT